jgi:nucleoside-diphosphate-sugar epimerase
MVLPELAALGKPVLMPPDDTESDWIYTADAAEAWYRAMNTPKPPRLVYNLAAERRRMADVTAHLRKDLSFEPRYTMESGLTDYVNAVREAAGLSRVKG